MEGVVIDARFWRGRRVFLTGHTGFKGAWLSLLLARLGAKVSGFALAPESERDLFVAANVEADVRHTIADVRDPLVLRQAITAAEPEIVIHMAAQSLVLRSYEDAPATYATNVMGTVHLLDAIRVAPSVRATVIITSDKCYENIGRTARYREGDPLGGRDPYSNSKACAELVTAAYRRSFFSNREGPRIATARAGNVVGGGDWARDRLVPDAMRAFGNGEVLKLRNPRAVRPWQHVLDPLLGYLLLAQRLLSDAEDLDEAWNFGPSAAGEVAVEAVVKDLALLWGADARWALDGGIHPHEAGYLALDCAKAETRLGWQPRISLPRALAMTVEWYRAAQADVDLRALTLRQIDEVLANEPAAKAGRSGHAARSNAV